MYYFFEKKYNYKSNFAGLVKNIELILKIIAQVNKYGRTNFRIAKRKYLPG